MSRLLLNQSIVSMTMNMNSSASTSNSTSSSSSHRLPGLSFGESNGSPGISFPLGTGLVVLIILFVSGLFSFCYHWLSLRKNASSSSSSSSATHDSPQHHPSDDCFKPPTKLSMVQCPPVVYMAGEETPRFIAVPCPLLKPCAEESRDAEKQVLGDVTLIDDLKLDIKL